MPPRRSYTPLLAFKFETISLHVLSANENNSAISSIIWPDRNSPQRTVKSNPATKQRINKSPPPEEILDLNRQPIRYYLAIKIHFQ